MKQQFVREQRSNFRSLFLEKRINWTKVLLDEINKAKVPKFWGKVGGLFKTDRSEDIAPLKNTSAHVFENSENTDLLRENCFTRKDLTTSDFDNFFYGSIKEEVKQLSVKAGEHWCNDPLSWRDMN